MRGPSYDGWARSDLRRSAASGLGLCSGWWDANLTGTSENPPPPPAQASSFTHAVNDLLFLPHRLVLTYHLLLLLLPRVQVLLQLEFCSRFVALPTISLP